MTQPKQHTNQTDTRTRESQDGMKRSAMSRLLYKMYGRRRLRGWVLKYLRKAEGHHYFSATWRDIQRDYHGVDIGAYSYGECFVAGSFPAGVTVGRYVSIARDVLVFLRNHPMDRLTSHPFFFNQDLGYVERDTIDTGTLEIGHDAWIGARAIITPGCHRIGIGAVVGAGAVVTRDVPDFAIVAGNPAKLIRERFTESGRAAVLESKWWERSILDLKEHIQEMNKAVGENPFSHPLLSAPTSIEMPAEKFHAPNESGRGLNKSSKEGHAA